MPETTPPLHDAWLAAKAKAADVQARCAAEIAAVNAELEAAEAALANDLQEGVLQATAPIPPLIKRVGNRIEQVEISFLGDPHPAAEPAPAAEPTPA